MFLENLQVKIETSKRLATPAEYRAMTNLEKLEYHNQIAKLGRTSQVRKSAPVRHYGQVNDSLILLSRQTAYMPLPEAGLIRIQYPEPRNISLFIDGGEYNGGSYDKNYCFFYCEIGSENAVRKMRLKPGHHVLLGQNFYLYAQFPQITGIVIPPVEWTGFYAIASQCNDSPSWIEEV